MKVLECIFAVLLVWLLAITNALIPSNNDAPKIIEGPTPAVVIEGSTIVLKCRTSGNPKPTITWESNGNILGTGRHEILATGDLKIERVYSFESAEYSCKAANQYGEVKESAKLDVRQRTRIYKNSHIKKIAVGQTVIFQCRERHDENLSVQIEWLKDDESIDYKKLDRYSKSDDNSLIVNNTIRADSGEYTCVARTEIDEDRAVITLVVQDVPNPPIIKDVTCDGLRAEIMWKKRGDNRSPILSYSIEYNTSFTPQKWEVGQARVHSSKLKYAYVMNPWATYSFRVIAHNRIGQSSPSEHSTTCTTQPDVPYKNPDNVKTEASDPSLLVITWTPMPKIEHSGPKLHYRVFWKRDIPHSEWFSKDIFDWQESKFVVSGQPMFVRYLVKVVAINELGESKIPALEIIGYSGEDRPLLAPTKFKMFDLKSSTSALLKWDPVKPESLRGHFKGYKLQTWTADEGKALLREEHIDNDVNEILFNKLKPNSKNFVRLCAYNSRFDGPSTVISFITPEGTPSAVQNLKVFVLSALDVLFTWDKPLEPNGRLTGYKIYFAEIQDDNVIGERLDSLQYLDDPLITSAKLTHLKPDTKYRITVVAKTAMGEGIESFVDDKTLRLDRKPEKPSEPNFKWEPMTSVKVTWQPFNGHPTGTHFFTQYRVKGQTEWHDTHEQKDEDSQIIGVLSRDAVYEFRVLSVNGKFKKGSKIQELKTL